VGLAFSTSTVALVNFLLLALFMRQRLGRLEGRRLGRTIMRVVIASGAMASVVWMVAEGVTALPLHGHALHFIQVVASVASAAIVFYLACRILQVKELDDAINAIAGRFIRRLRRV